MKKILTALAITSLTVSPAMAHQRNHEHHHGGGSKWVAPLLGGLIIGALLSKGSDNSRQEQQPPTYIYPPQTTYEYVPSCWYEERTDYYGNIRVYKVCR